jgi:hypothetical protein
VQRTVRFFARVERVDDACVLELLALACEDWVPAAAIAAEEPERWKKATSRPAARATRPSR